MEDQRASPEGAPVPRPDTPRSTDRPLIVEVEFDYDGRRLRQAIAFLLTYRRAERVTDLSDDQESDALCR